MLVCLTLDRPPFGLSKPESLAGRNITVDDVNGFSYAFDAIGACRYQVHRLKKLVIG